MNRRDLLRAGALGAVGAALLPSVAGAGGTDRAALIERLRQDYLRRVRELAPRLAPKYATAPEFDREDDLYRFGWALEDECREALCPTEEDARLVILVSPNTGREDIPGLEPADDVRDGAKMCAAFDVAALIGADWYVEANA